MGLGSSVNKQDAKQEVEQFQKAEEENAKSQDLTFVYTKIDENPYYEPLHKNITARKKFAECLSNEKQLKETYLNPNWTITLEMHDRINKLHKEAKEKKEKKKSASLVPTTTTTSNNTAPTTTTTTTTTTTHTLMNNLTLQSTSEEAV